MANPAALSLWELSTATYRRAAELLAQELTLRRVADQLHEQVKQLQQEAHDFDLQGHQMWGENLPRGEV